MIISEALTAFSHLFYPTICLGCNKNEINPGEWTCFNCLINLPFTHFETTRNNPVEQLFWGRTPIYLASSCFFYVEKTTIQRLIHEVKYKEQLELGKWMGRVMGLKLNPVFKEHQIDLMVPMPLHPKKEKQRGYNQATLLCNGIRAATSCEYDEDVLIRNTHTKTQTKKTRIERWENVVEVFSIPNKNCIKDKHVAIIDDVITTGASTEACANTLLEAGAKAVSICSLAFTL